MRTGDYRVLRLSLVDVAFGDQGEKLNEGPSVMLTIIG